MAAETFLVRTMSDTGAEKTMTATHVTAITTPSMTFADARVTNPAVRPCIALAPFSPAPELMGSLRLAPAAKGRPRAAGPAPVPRAA